MKRRTYDGARHARLERRLDLLLNKLLEVDVVRKERVRPDLLRPVHAQALRRVSREQARQYTPRLHTDVVPEHERVVQDLLVHVVRVLCRNMSSPAT